jgi:hypothetical protein
LIAGLAADDSGTETKRQGEQQTPRMPSDKAHALLQETGSSSTNKDRDANPVEQANPASMDTFAVSGA